MLYKSTRGSYETPSSAEALLRSIAPDGGLLVPETLPYWDKDRLNSLRPLSFAQRMASILADFLPDLNEQDLLNACKEVYEGDRFQVLEVAKVIGLNRYVNREFLLELWHGPTASFQDISMQLLPHLLRLAADRLGDRREWVVLTATAGDTGSALFAAFAQLPNTHTLVLYPSRGLTEIQCRQLYAFTTNNCHVLPVRASYDEALKCVRHQLLDPALALELEPKNRLLMTANSLSWARLLPHIAVFVSAYVDLLQQEAVEPGEAVNLVVPGGSFGALMAAWYARQMGVPYRKLVCACNRNKCLSDFFSNGHFDARRELAHTNTPALDVLQPGNLERLLFELSGQKGDRVAAWMEALEQEGGFQVEPDILRRLQAVFVGGFADNQGTVRTIRELYDRTDFCVDTHTAIGFNVYARYAQRSKDETKVLYASPSSPFKVVAEVTEALFPNSEPEDPCKLLEPLAKEIGLPLQSSFAAVVAAELPESAPYTAEEWPRVVRELILGEHGA